MNSSLPSINPKTIAQIKLALSAWGTDAEFLAKFVESVLKIRQGSGFGKISIYIEDSNVTLIRSEETHRVTPTVEENKF